MKPSKVFISYSHEDSHYLDELFPVLKAVPGMEEKIWYDTEKIDYGEKFDERIKQGLEDSSAAILLLSNNYFSSSYMREREIPYLVKQAEKRVLRLGIHYLNTIPDPHHSV